MLFYFSDLRGLSDLPISMILVILWYLQVSEKFWL